MQITQNLVSSSKYNIKCPYAMTPAGICIHNTANDASAANEISYMISNGNKTSFHYAVDDKEIVQGIPLNRNAWHAGDGGSGEGNRKYISIEICYSKSGGSRFEAAMNNAAYLTAKLLRDYGWDISHVKKHQDFSGKYCPHRILDDYGWDYFLNLVKAELNGSPAANDTFESGKTYTVKITADTLNVRDGAGTNYAVNTTVSNGGIYTVTEVRGDWGLLKSGAGWINLKYTAKVSETESAEITDVTEAINALVAAKVINTPDYWSAHAGDMAYVDTLIIAMANAHLRASEKNGYTTVEQALSAMASLGVINTPEYWKANYGAVQYLDTLIIRFANRLWV